MHPQPKRGKEKKKRGKSRDGAAGRLGLQRQRFLTPVLFPEKKRKGGGKKSGPHAFQADHLLRFDFAPKRKKKKKKRRE